MSDNAFEYLKNNNKLFKLYNELLHRLNDFPKLTIKTRKSYLKAIVLCNRKNFGCISLLDSNNSVMYDGFRVVFYMGEEIQNKRVKVVPEHQPEDFVYYVTIKTEKDIDIQLLEWLRKAYDNAK
ncbi:hypothetical protein M2146_002444 [Lachnospiraceae bacterium PF1-22]|uniref:DUF5655 domain-containing protein n=1 Tax=Ohessyouella blattaphilus TaxID=2949333 RepID=UPI003E285CDB